MLNLYEAHKGMYQFRHLPQLARIILDGHLDEYARQQYTLSVRLHLPLLQHLKHFSEPDLLQLTCRSAGEFLESLAANEGRAHIVASVERWLANELEFVDYLQIVVEDITVLNHIRAESLRHFIPFYTKDLAVALEAVCEVERFFMGYNTTSLATFIDLLRQRLSQQEAQLLEAEAIAHLGSFTWDLRTNRTESSPEMRLILETTEPVGLERFLELVHPDDGQHLKESIANAFATGLLECEFRYQASEQEKTLWAKGIVYFDNGEPLRMAGVVQDITERKRMEATLLRKTLELERSNEELQQFASVASHDLKEPLRKIVLYADLLEEEHASLSGRGLQHLVRIKDGARRMRHLIEDILAWSSLNQREEPVPAPLEKILAESLELLDQRIREKGARIVSDGLPAARVIPFQIRQLFQNLLSNALKFTRPGVAPEVQITHRYLDGAEVPARRLSEAGRYLELCFKDNGIGFEPHFAEKVFGLFSRLHTRAQFEGTGLGLAICRKVAENHGGIIEASAQPGSGATFRLLLPQ
ncbi:sensor histidine kinase [Flaviaesturariibacter amylovorans]|uniref:histidine kinase n=1 Tax=Flaviaesturariibacter amylovorans TaxID=1084520 RepID=A0ABP8GVP8_9BACT